MPASSTPKPPMLARHRQRTALGWENVRDLPCWHWEAAQRLAFALSSRTATPNSHLRKILPISYHVAQGLLGEEENFHNTRAEYLASKWCSTPARAAEVPAIADQEHPLPTMKPHHLWLLREVTGPDYALAVLNAQAERNQSTRTHRNESFEHEYLAVLACLSQLPSHAQLRHMPIVRPEVRYWNGEKFTPKPERDYDKTYQEHFEHLKFDTRPLRAGVREIVNYNQEL